MSIELRNPHSVLAVLKQRPQALQSLQVPPGKVEAAWREVMELAESQGIRASRATTIQASAGHRTAARDSRAMAVVRDKPLATIEEAWPLLEGQQTSLCLALDQIQDPQNLGAILRSAAFFGVTAVFLTRDRSAPLTSTAYDVSAGGVEFLTIVEVPNLSRLLEEGKQREIWILGTSEHAKESLSTVSRDRNWMLVVGNEQRGLRRLTLDLCDQVVSIPSMGGVGSLNVSAATAIALFQLSQPES